MGLRLPGTTHEPLYFVLHHILQFVGLPFIPPSVYKVTRNMRQEAHHEPLHRAATLSWPSTRTGGFASQTAALKPTMSDRLQS